MSSTEIWWVIGGAVLVTALIKAAGPVLLGGRPLPAPVMRVIALMAPALLAALVATAVLSRGTTWGVGADTAGVAAAALVLWRGGSIVPAAVVAVLVTAAIRALT